MGNIIPIMPVAIDLSMRRVVATKPIARTTSIPMRSGHGARLKPSHHTAMASAPATPPMTPIMAPSGQTRGTR